MRRDKKRKEEERKKCKGKELVSLLEDMFETHAGPADRTCVRWKSDRATLHAPTKPVEKLPFLAVDEYGTTSNPERSDSRLVRA